MSERTDGIIETIEVLDLLLDGKAHGSDPAAQGAILAQLLTRWLMRHPKAERKVVYDLHLLGVRNMWARREKDET